ncbi:Histone acetyltransferase GCN5 [Tritrichomonas foetus]|uniref:histone acetyltransferase n=1 Tax=Tritrichomonas foetus TaxID=1144522 RepID=A0A1J4KVU0_9EUKA|nr:Histone acetyltransferase GCN5 [Tritrichomonas foetus]|eukprot:OHT15347.1 Histone acetyltransferase GCN5 [Tritrichomonas foetus]
MEPQSWLSRRPHASNHRLHPGLRHYSRLHTKPAPFIRPPDSHPESQIKFVRNRFNIHSQALMHLCDGMHLFSRQLPNMGTPYIARLVYDVEAFSVLLLHEGRVAGGICSRLFTKEAFIEIVFCAVDSKYQARGYGRFVMNNLKVFLQNMEIFDILTCADNEAVTYFRKQGFNKHEILMHPSRWVGCIKDYDGITLVHCKIRPDVDYLHFPSNLQKQISLLKGKTGIASQPALKKLIPQFAAFPQAPSFVNISIPELLKNYKPFDESKLKKMRTRQFMEDYNNRMALYKDKYINIINKLKANSQFSMVFTRPVTEEIAPTYFTLIKKPMDFWTLEKRLMRYPDYYKRPEIFAADINQMCENCKTFNTPDTTYYKTAIDLMKKFRQLYDAEFPDFPIP